MGEGCAQGIEMEAEAQGDHTATTVDKENSQMHTLGHALWVFRPLRTGVGIGVRLGVNGWHSVPRLCLESLHPNTWV